MLIETLRQPHQVVYYLLGVAFGFLILYATVALILNSRGGTRREPQPLIPSLLVQGVLLASVTGLFFPISHFLSASADAANRQTLATAFPGRTITEDDLACVRWAVATEERKKECAPEDRAGALVFQPVAQGVKVTRVEAAREATEPPRLVCRPFKKGFHLYIVFADGTESRIKTPVAGMDLPLAACSDGKPIPSQVP